MEKRSLMLSTSPRGMVAIAASIALAFSVVVFGDVLILLILLLIISVLSGDAIWMTIVTRNPSRWFSIRRRSEKGYSDPVISERMHPEDVSEVELVLSFKSGNRTGRVLSVGSENEFLDLRFNSERTGGIEIVARFRGSFAGRYETNALLVRMRGPFGLFEGVLRVPVSLSYTVYPKVVEVALSSLKILAKGGIGETPIDRPGIGTEFYDLREYQHGDDYRSINWKASARRGELMVVERAKEVGSSYYIVLDTSAPDYFDRDRLASTFLQIANTLASLRVRFGVIVQREDEILGLLRAGVDSRESLVFALENALGSIQLTADEIPEELLSAIPSYRIKSLQKVLEGKNLSLLSEIERSASANSQKVMRTRKDFQNLEDVIRANPSEIPSVLYVTGMFGSIAHLVELGAYVTRIRSSEFIVVNPTAPWIVARNETLAMEAYARHKRGLRVLMSAGIECVTGTPISVVRQIFSSG